MLFLTPTNQQRNIFPNNHFVQMNFKFLHSQELPVASSLLKILHVFKHPFIHLFHQILQIRSSKTSSTGEEKNASFSTVVPSAKLEEDILQTKIIFTLKPKCSAEFQLFFQNCFSKILLRNNLLPGHHKS